MLFIVFPSGYNLYVAIRCIELAKKRLKKLVRLDEVDDSERGIEVRDDPQNDENEDDSEDTKDELQDDSEKHGLQEDSGEDVFKGAKHAYLEDDCLPNILLDIANYEDLDLVQDSLLLLDRYYSIESSMFQKALKSQLLVTKESKSLHDQISIRTSEDVDLDGVKVCSLKELAESCWLKNEAIGYEPHQINQNIILSFGEGISCAQ